MTQVVLVCSANRCRSPMAQGLLGLRLPAHSGVRVISAGLLPGGQPAPPDAIRRMLRYGVDLSTHVSLQISPDVLADADLILGMSRRHVRTLVADNSRLRPRSFTIKDFVRRARADQAEHPDLAELARRLDSQRPRVNLLGTAAEDDVVDPMGRSAATWDSVVRELDTATAELAHVLSCTVSG